MAAAFQLQPSKELFITRKYLFLLSACLLSNGIWTVTFSTLSIFEVALNDAYTLMFGSVTDK